MPPRTIPLLALADLEPGQEADLFALLFLKEELLTRDRKPYWKVGFRDARREVVFPIWSDAPWAAECRAEWTIGVYYKLRAVYRETPYGGQLEIVKIRETTESDRADGFDPTMCLPQSHRDPRAMFDELCALVADEIAPGTLRALVMRLLEDEREGWLALPAARRNHHAYVGGLVEHTLSVAHTAVYLARKYATAYTDLDPPLDTELVVAGAVLHDVGKLRELEQRPEAAVFTPEGALAGHVILGRDLVRAVAADVGLAGERLLRLEHVILSHQRLPEWGSPKPPMTPEALLVHYADDVDAKFQMMFAALAAARGDERLTTSRHPLGYPLYRGESARDG